ncbi:MULTISPECIES: flagellar biosynthesis protein FlhA [unclassified Luteibacter]|uniref:flagellar biosynthesis protein FlhA n=1 Tax=Luteibacter sp. PvP019 TaxID=3156436 RepID=UPI003393B262
MNTLRYLLKDKGQLILVSAMIFILTILFVPVPPGLLDFLLIVNFSVALLVLLITFLTDSPLNFSTFPSLLLIATLFRLALNVSATRLILNGGNAGKVIGAVGSYVVGGNYVIGLVVFLILVVVQYVVVTSGAQRVAEVAARFTLDSMPGKQMSIDADMNMGLIDEAEARRRRSMIEREANFYGAMDGATKFVKGDAVAGIIILLIDIVGGLSIGMLQHGMPWTEAVHRYTLLTVGDGIVTQIPSLVIAVATGIIITRAASDAELGSEIAKQVLSNPRTLLVVGITLFLVMLLPGLPALPVLAVLAGLGFMIHVARKKAGDTPEESSASEPSKPASAEEDFYNSLDIEPLEIRLGAVVAETFRSRTTDINERVQSLRRQFALDYGFVLPSIMTREGALGTVSDHQYQVFLHGNRIGQGELHFDGVLAINPGGSRPKLEGRETRDPAYGLPAQWIAPDTRQFARGAGYTLVDPDTVLVTHLNELAKRHAAELLSRAEVERLSIRLKERQSSLVDELVPGLMSYTDIQKVLQCLLRELVSIRQLETIFETLADAAKTTKNAEELAERVRERLGATICQRASNDQGELHVLTLAPEFERSMLVSARQREGHGHGLLVADASQLDGFLASLARQSDAMLGKSLSPVLLCPAALRRQLRSMIQRSLPHIAVIGVNELPATVMVRAFATVNPTAT